MPPKPKKAVQSAKKITSVRKAIPKVAAKKSAKKTTSPPTKGKKPATTGRDMTRPGPLGPRNGSGSIPFQGPGPMGQGVY